MQARIVATLILASILPTASPSRAFVLGDGRGKVEGDCLLGLDVGDVEVPVPFGPKAQASIQCTDCDPACDGDGVDAANGSCTFGVRACVNVPSPFVSCTATNVTKARAVVKRKGTAAVDLSPVPAGTSFVCGSAATVPVAVKRREAGDRPGTAQVRLLATAAGRPRDRDKLLLVCIPRPTGEACPPGNATTTTTLPPQVLGTPFGLRTTTSLQGPPRFVLRWNFDEGTLPVDTFLVHESATGFSAQDATLIATATATARAADVELRAGTGVRRFRVTAVSFDGIASTVSPELAIDTTPRVVMIADKTENDVFELFSVVPGSGAEPTPLSGPLPPDADVDRFFFSPDGRHVAFTADKDQDGVFGIFVAPLDGSSEAKQVSGLFAIGGAAQQFFFVFSPDGTRIAFVGDKFVDERLELLVAPVDGNSEPIAVSGALVDGGDVDVDEFAWSPDGRRLAFIADKLVDGTSELFVADAAGGSEPTKVSGTLVAGGQVQGFAWSPDGTRLAMRASKETANFDEFFVADPGGAGEPLRVTGTLPAFAPVNSDPLWSPDSTRLAVAGDFLTNAIFELSVVAADGGSAAPFRVSGASQAFSDIVNFKWSPDGTRLAFNMDKNLDNADEVFIANAAGGAEPIRVSGAFATDEEAFNVQWSPRGDRVAYFADPTVAGRFELFVAEADVVDGALPASGPVGASNEVFQFAWAPDGASLVIVGDLETDGLSEVFVTPAVGGGLPVKVSGTMQPVGGASSSFFGFAPLSN